MELEKGNSILLNILDIMDLSCNIWKTPLYAYDRMSEKGKCTSIKIILALRNSERVSKILSSPQGYHI